MPEHRLLNIDFQPSGRRVSVPWGTIVLEAARLAGSGLASDCGGQGTCGLCRIIVVLGDVASPGDDEISLLRRLDAAPEERLACLTRLLGDARVLIPPKSRLFDQRMQIKGRTRRAVGDRVIQAYEVALTPADIHDQRSDLARLIDALSTYKTVSETVVHPRIVEEISILARDSNRRLTVYLRDDRMIGVEGPGRSPVGLAVDLGTSKMAGILYDCRSGRELAASGKANPQIAYGEDVMSRLSYALREKGGAGLLRDLARKALKALTEDLCARAGIEATRAAEVVLAGNTAMAHLFLGLPVDRLARAPFTAGFSSPLELPAREAGLDIARDARIHVLPCIGGFVGGDHTAMILACELDRSPATALGIDIGTNTEVVLAKPGSPGSLHVVSCASGPAFEGAHIRDGMRAGPGAVERVRITSDGPEVETVGGVPPLGICGSGLVDALAGMVRCGIVDRRGHLRPGVPGVRGADAAGEYVLVPSEKSGSGRDICITQKDISELQLAKGAIRAGVQTLLQRTETRPDEIETVYIAGAFGSHLDTDSLLTVGVLPDFPRAHFVQSGNAAVVGAGLALVSKQERSRAAEIARRARHIELAADENFSRLFARSMQFE